MRVARNEEHEASHAQIGPCFISVNHPTWYMRTYRVSIAVRDEAYTEPEWHRFELAEDEIRDLAEAKEWAIERARALGCRRSYTRHDYDEEWLAELREAMFEELQRAADRYENDMSWYQQESGWTTRPNIFDYGLSTSYFVGLFDPNEAGHYLGKNHSRKEIRRAVTLLLNRLDRAGLIEPERWNRKKYWYLAGAI